MPTCRTLANLLRFSSLLLLFGGCALSFAPDDADSSILDAPRVCDIGADGTALVLEPLSGNPSDCSAPIECELWFGHGQHLSCPPLDGSYPPDTQCSIWECLCDDSTGFVADFASGEVFDERGDERCEYRIRYVEP